ncbi:hypothetical protein RDI58_019951 [Solanum bulbocastanum]|uniref:Uncharacterized protein n=1 Tax=Solanum bulbocastanum TaxID=147425 RepID=A0AAN8Y721_SOLBU
MTKKSRHLTREFYSTYVATLLNFETAEGSKKQKKEVALKSEPLDEVVIHSIGVDIPETVINRFLHGPKYTTPTMVGLYKDHHHMSRESIMR